MNDTIRKVSLTALTMSKDLSEDKYAQLLFSIRAGYPRITVYTEKNKKRQDNDTFDYNKIINAPLDYLTAAKLYSYAMDVIDNGDNGTNRQIVCYNVKYVDGVRTNEVYIQATIEIGKDKDGIIYLAVLADGKPKIKFDILPRDNGKWHKSIVNGNPVVDKNVISCETAKVYFDHFKYVVDKYAAIDTVKVTELSKKIPSISVASETSVDTTPITDDDLF